MLHWSEILNMDGKKSVMILTVMYVSQHM